MEYLLKASALIAIFYLCYKLFLQRDTFFESNRWFLLIGLVAAFALPFVVIPIYIEYTPMPIQNFVINDAYSVVEAAEDPFNFWQLGAIVYVVGVLLFFIRFLVQLGSLALLIAKNNKYKQNGFTFIETQTETPPFSFFKWIVYNPNTFNKDELQHIIAHEKVHANQYHSIDILISQMASIVFWFNPITWFYKKELQQNLEFIADYKAQNQSSCKKSYQHLLLKTSVANHHTALTNNFYNSLIKKRIVMLHKSKSKKINLLKYALVLPFLTLFLMGFNTEEVYVEKVSENNSSTNITNKVEQQEISKESDRIKIIFRKNLSDKDLKKIKKKLQNMDVVFTYSELKRNTEGEIVKIIAKFETEGGSCIYNSDQSPIEPFYYFKHEETCGVGGIEYIKTVNDEFDFKNSKTLDFGSSKNTHNSKTQPKRTTAKQNPKNQEIKPFSVTITKNFTNNDFKDAIKRGKEKGVTLKFSKIKRNTKNEIIGIFAEFKTENGSGNYTINSGKPIHSFAYEQDNESFGFAGVSQNNVKVSEYYGNLKFKEGNKVISADSIIFNKKHVNGILVYTDSIKSKSNPWKISVGRNVADSINATPLKTVVGHQTSNSIVFGNSLKVKNGVKPLILLDDLEIPEEDLNAINPNEIESITILKDKKATALYGDKAKNGVVIIESKNNQNYKVKTGRPLHEPKNSWKIASKRNNNVVFATKDTIYFNEKPSLLQEIKNGYKHQPLYIVDGKEINKKEFNSINEQNIESISQLNSEDAVKKYGQKGKHGAIILTIRKISSPKSIVKIKDTALYILDGKEIKKDKFESIDPNDIESVNVVKGASAIKKYGKKAKDGVIEITIKQK
ncbi:M56 family metallopeptidase [Gelatiniphilus marinus]|uniref:TonB-dependent receptor plug domain-containing protein n=1 Tax=Gelatiniphilus marinus TaxID=1759464 RepID=A0ABW5JSQ4_9FLAO